MKRQRAKAAARYFTGKPCKRGHVCERDTRTHACIECRRDYNQRWHYQNRVIPRRVAAAVSARVKRTLTREEMQSFLAIYARMSAEGAEALIGDELVSVGADEEVDSVEIPYLDKLTLLLAAADKHYHHGKPN